MVDISVLKLLNKKCGFTFSFRNSTETGRIITGIRLAEKKIPDDTPNAGLAKLDAALRFVLDAYAQANHGKQPPSDLVEQIKQGIQIKHLELDRWGGLSKPKAAAG